MIHLSKQGNYIIKPVLIIIIWISSTLNFFGQTKESDQKYPVDSLRQWTSGLMDEISKKHPELYRYTDKEKFGFLIDSTQQSIQDSLTQLQYYRKLKPLFAKIGCLHTGIELPEKYKAYLYTNAVDQNKNFGHGTIPNHETAITFENWISKQDVELNYTIELINKK